MAYCLLTTSFALCSSTEFGVEKSFDVEGLPAAEVGSKISAAMKA
jgi:hypothetical protein